MRWFPTLLFSHSNSSSSPSPSPSSSSTPTSSLATLKSSSSTSSSVSHTGRNTRSAWFFGGTRKSTRSRKLSHVADIDAVVITPLSRSTSTFDRSSTPSAEPQPLPLPRAIDSRLPSPKDAADKPNAVVDFTLPAGFQMRSVFARQENRNNTEHVETRSPGVVPQQDTSGCTSTRAQGDNFWLSVPARSAPTSPFASPRIIPNTTKTDDFVPYYYVSPKANQFWSAPEMPTSDPSAGHPPPAFFDLSALRTDTILSPHQSPRGKSPTPHPKSPNAHSSSSSPSIPPRLSLDISMARREITPPQFVHPLPLPPWAGPVAPLLSPSATFSPPVAKTESLPMKNQWQKGKLIGRGTFGSVYVATNRKTGALCAMKEAEVFSDDPKSAECIRQLEQEIKVLSQLKHPNIVQYFGSEIVEDRFYIYLEYVHPGSMNKYVREHCGAITECVVRSFTRHILSGLAYLHSKKTIHRDIKGANLLVDSAGVVKLADFGMAKHLTGHVAELSLKGSPYWMAPELMQAVVQKGNSTEVAFAVDIWSLGCTIIEMFTGKPPWSEYEGAAAMFKVMRDTPPIPETLSAEGKDFLRLCFIRNPAERPSASMLLDHIFLKNL
ncbi:hypothetical protein VNO80_09521 [Phaseolus coccineus]|uniref:mitogen-activated protein kinase kinase kinase n=1 Tax=Phaseolus coccineus TaxID=3886 RepID=A0AAN9NBR9_PHACN